MKKSLLLLAAAAPLLVGCAASSVAESDVEDTTKEKLSAEKVDCPDDLKAEEGETMECTATLDGKELKIKLTVTSADDDGAEWSIAFFD